MAKLQLRENEVLRLYNVLSHEIRFDGQSMQNSMAHLIACWINNAGNEPVGPLISYSSKMTGLEDNGEPIVKTKVMMQLRDKLVSSEQPYDFTEEIVVEDCIFVRFQDKAENLPYAYSKISLLAYEKDIRLNGDSYTVFISGKDAGNIVADIFMPVADNQRFTPGCL